MNAQLARRHLWYLRRAWDGADLCRDRVDAANESAPVIEAGEWQVFDLRANAGHDLDYYAWECVRILKIADKVIRAGLRGSREVERARADLESEAPQLVEFRNQVTHVEDNRGSDDVFYFPDAVRLLPDGKVEEVLDPRYRQHDLIGALVVATERALLTLASKG